jgi:predicted double-glycine peptidase
MSYRPGLAGALLIAASVFSGLASATPTLPGDALPLPLIRQATTYSCGAASLLSVAYYWGVFEDTETDLYAALGTTPENGTQPAKIAEVARKLGLGAESREHLGLNDLAGFLREGRTVIIDLQAWRDEKTSHLPWKDDWADGHYVVLNALDGRNAYFMDPSAGVGYGYMPLGELLDRWHDEDLIDGKPYRNDHLGIVIWGRSRLNAFPGALVRIR